MNPPWEFARRDDFEGPWLKIVRIGSIAIVIGACLATALIAAGLAPGAAQLGEGSAAPPDPQLIARAAALYAQRTSPAPANLPDAAAVQSGLSAQAAYKLNAAMPISTAANPAALPFVLTASPEERARALECLTAAVYYEAAYESDAGQRAVAQVVLNRVRHPAFPKDVCGVVFQGSNLKTGCQFSFTCDGSLARKPASAPWARARQVANSALSGGVMAGVGQATHYHTVYVAPRWRGELVKVRKIGAHLFYRWNGAGGAPGAFNGAYQEPGAVAETATLSNPAAPAAPPPGQEIPLSTDDAVRKSAVAAF